MSSPVVLGTALAAAACLACGGHDDRSSDPAPAGASSPARLPGPIELRDPDGELLLSFATDGRRCLANTRHPVVVTRDGTATQIGGTDLTLERTPAGDQLSRKDQRLARIWRDPARPGHIDVVDPAGMALVRIDSTPAGATLADASGAPTAHVVFEGGRFIARDHADRALAYVNGGDGEIAALLASPLPLDLRAFAVCDRLLAPVSQ